MRTEKGFSKLAPVFVVALLLGSVAFIGISPGQASGTIIRDVNVSILPSYQSGGAGSTLNYIVVVSNEGNVEDTYVLTVSDNAGWFPSVSPTSFTLKVGFCGNATLSVTIPENAIPGSIQDVITVTATSQADPTVSDSASCIAYQPELELDPSTLYEVNLMMNLYLENGSKLVVKFYTWGGAFQGENVVWSGATPDSVSFLKTVPHPGNEAVEKARLDLTTDNTEDVISTLSTFVVRKWMLEVRFMEIPGEWFMAPPADRITLELEFSAIGGKWFLAPS